MSINKNNYEAYFLDYYEQNLSAEEVAELLLFVELHPDLKEEFENFESISIDNTETCELKNKASLKKIVLSDNTCSEYVLQEVDYLLISDLERTITSKEKKQLQQLIKNNRFLKDEANLYTHTLLKPDVNIVFENKQVLKKKKASIIPFYYSIAIAASIAIIIGISYLSNNNSEEKTPLVETKQSVIIDNNNEVNNNVVDSNISKNSTLAILSSKNTKKIKKTPIEEKSIIDTLENITPDLIPTKTNVELVNTHSFVEVEENENINETKTIENNSIKKNNIANIQNNENEYLSIKEFTLEKMKETFMDNENTFQKRNKKLSGWDIAQFALRSIKKITGRSVIELTPNYNDNGSITSYAVKAGKFEFSKAL